MTRSTDVRFDVVRNGVKFDTLAQVGASSIRMSGSSQIKTALSGQFAESADFNMYTDEIRPVLITDGVERPCGIFLPAVIAETRQEGIKTLSIEAYDRCWQLYSKRTEERIHFAAGTNYLTVVKSLLVGAGILLISETPTEYVLRSDREDWDIGTDYLTIINILLNEINYNSVWFDSFGAAVLSPERAGTAFDISRVYNEREMSSLMIAKYQKEIDLFDSPNVFICVCDNPDFPEVLKSVVENRNPVSPLSINKRGKRVAQMFYVDNIPSQNALDDYAYKLCVRSMMSAEHLTVNTLLLPDCGVNDIVAVSVPEVSGLFVETGWKMELTVGGVMEHTLERVEMNL